MSDENEDAQKLGARIEALEETVTRLVGLLVSTAEGLQGVSETTVKLAEGVSLSVQTIDRLADTVKEGFENQNLMNAAMVESIGGRAGLGGTVQ